ncbi:MAG TPA: hypothetical protein VIY48_14290 [Candidatus Paceibacterota bacterium]
MSEDVDDEGDLSDEEVQAIHDDETKRTVRQVLVVAAERLALEDRERYRKQAQEIMHEVFDCMDEERRGQAIQRILRWDGKGCLESQLEWCGQCCIKSFPKQRTDGFYCWTD